jgi:cation transport ATPase
MLTGDSSRIVAEAIGSKLGLRPEPRFKVALLPEDKVHASR